MSGSLCTAELKPHGRCWLLKNHRGWHETYYAPSESIKWRDDVMSVAYGHYKEQSRKYRVRSVVLPPEAKGHDEELFN